MNRWTSIPEDIKLHHKWLFNHSSYTSTNILKMTATAHSDKHTYVHGFLRQMPHVQHELTRAIQTAKSRVSLVICHHRTHTYYLKELTECILLHESVLVNGKLLLHVDLVCNNLPNPKFRSTSA